MEKYIPSEAFKYIIEHPNYHSLGKIEREFIAFSSGVTFNEIGHQFKESPDANKIKIFKGSIDALLKVASWEAKDIQGLMELFKKHIKK